MVELKPCPFCGCAARIEVEGTVAHLFAQHAEKCVFDADDAMRSLQDPKGNAAATLVSEWNRRPPAAAVGAAQAQVVREVPDLSTLTRFDPEPGNYDRASMKECDDGDYVRIDDVRELLATSPATVTAPAQPAESKDRQILIDTAGDLAEALPKPNAWRIGADGEWHYGSMNHCKRIRAEFEESFKDEPHEEPEGVYTAEQCQQVQLEAISHYLRKQATK